MVTQVVTKFKAVLYTGDMTSD